jgi:hypothetical protein
MTSATRYPGLLVATRSIVTSQPDVACDVCMRRLLRGERPDVFLAGGRRLTVCELCAPRAAHEGWLRERDAQAVSLPPARPRRGRGLFSRLRLRGEPAEPGTVVESPAMPSRMAVDELGSAGLETLAVRRSPVEPVPAKPVSAEPVPVESVSAEPAAAKPVSVEPVLVEPTPVEPALAEPADEVERLEDEFAADEAPEEGSWRDAWMFVTE